MADERRHAELLECTLGLVGERGRKARENSVGGLDKEYPRGSSVDRAEVAAKGVPGELGDLTCHLDAGRPAADDHEREPAPAPFVVGLDLGRLERAQDPVADVESAVE